MSDDDAGKQCVGEGWNANGTVQADGLNAGGGLFGFDISSMAGVLGTNAYKEYFGFPVSYTQGYITASMPAGSVFGTIASSVIADRYSRKSAIQVACVLWIIGSAYVGLGIR